MIKTTNNIMKRNSEIVSKLFCAEENDFFFAVVIVRHLA